MTGVRPLRHGARPHPAAEGAQTISGWSSNESGRAPDPKLDRHRDRSQPVALENHKPTAGAAITIARTRGSCSQFRAGGGAPMPGEVEAAALQVHAVHGGGLRRQRSAPDRSGSPAGDGRARVKSPQPNERTGLIRAGSTCAPANARTSMESNQPYHLSRAADEVQTPSDIGIVAVVVSGMGDRRDERNPLAREPLQYRRAWSSAARAVRRSLPAAAGQPLLPADTRRALPEACRRDREP
jgi:hypothetical protein